MEVKIKTFVIKPRSNSATWLATRCYLNQNKYTFGWRKFSIRFQHTFGQQKYFRIDFDHFDVKFKSTERPFSKSETRNRMLKHLNPKIASWRPNLPKTQNDISMQNWVKNPTTTKIETTYKNQNYLKFRFWKN